jgi:SAM-dependent methyltransferase
MYDAVMGALGVGLGTQLLDVGCGGGTGLVTAARLGARVSGLDAAAGMVAVARERLPQADLRVGEMEALPFAGGSFDVVTGFNSFQYAATPANALGEAKRVTRPGGHVAITVWGRKEDCQAAGFIEALGSFLAPPPVRAPGPFALSDETALRKLAGEGGLAPGQIVDIDCPFIYPDFEAALRATLSAGVAVRAIRVAGEAAVWDAVAGAIAPYRQASGIYRLENRFRCLIAAA